MAARKILRNRKSMKKRTIAICGIDTGVGKTVVTGLLADFLQKQGISVITQKPVQTGCQGKAEDLLLHRTLMGSSWNSFDEDGLSCSYCLKFPGSPHLAARLEGKRIDPAVISQASATLAAAHDVVLLESAGGLLVPLNEELLQLDYLHQCGHPLILVTSPRLGSLNHTLLALEAIKARDIPLLGLVYNLHGENPIAIVRDSRQYLKQALERLGFKAPLLLLPDHRESRSTNWQRLLDT